MRNQTLQVGQIVNTHGLRGEVKVVAWTDTPDDFERLKYVYADIGRQKQVLHIRSIKYQKTNLIVSLEESSSIEQAEGLKGAVLYVDREQLGEPEQGYYICDLIGISVHTDTGALLGKIVEVLQTGSNDVYVVRPPEGKDILLPVIDEVVLSVDIDQEIAIVHVLEGLLD